MIPDRSLSRAIRPVPDRWRWRPLAPLEDEPATPLPVSARDAPIVRVYCHGRLRSLAVGAELLWPWSPKLTWKPCRAIPTTIRPICVSAGQHVDRVGQHERALWRTVGDHAPSSPAIDSGCRARLAREAAAKRSPCRSGLLPEPCRRTCSRKSRPGNPTSSRPQSASNSQHPPEGLRADPCDTTIGRIGRGSALSGCVPVRARRESKSTRGLRRRRREQKAPTTRSISFTAVRGPIRITSQTRTPTAPGAAATASELVRGSRGPSA